MSNPGWAYDPSTGKTITGITENDVPFLPNGSIVGGFPQTSVPGYPTVTGNEGNISPSATMPDTSAPVQSTGILGNTEAILNGIIGGVLTGNPNVATALSSQNANINTQPSTGVVSFFTSPTRIGLAALGLVFIAGGLYLFGRSGANTLVLAANKELGGILERRENRHELVRRVKKVHGAVKPKVIEAKAS